VKKCVKHLKKRLTRQAKIGKMKASTTTDRGVKKEKEK
jgi:hypothetical protein